MGCPVCEDKLTVRDVFQMGQPKIDKKLCPDHAQEVLDMMEAEVSY